MCNVWKLQLLQCYDYLWCCSALHLYTVEHRQLSYMKSLHIVLKVDFIKLFPLHSKCFSSTFQNCLLTTRNSCGTVDVHAKTSLTDI